MDLYKAEGLVLRTRDLGEADKILVIFTREEGKVSAVARGARRARSRLLALSQPFTHAQFQLYRGRGLHTLSQGEILGAHRVLREDLVRMAYASYIAELVDATVEEGEPIPELFPLLLEAMALAERADDLETATRWFELHLMDQLGYRPELEDCVACGIAIDKEASFSSAQGGLLCAPCFQSDPSSVRLPPSTLMLLRRLRVTVAQRLGILQPGERDRATIEGILRRYIDDRFDRRFKAREFLDSVRQLG